MVNKIKERIQKIKPLLSLPRLVAYLKSTLYVALQVVCAGAFVFTLLYTAARAPEIHGYWLRSKVGSKVYMLRDVETGGGGTGFAVKAPSGTSYILTNDHICGISTDGTLLVTDDKDLHIRRRIIERSDFTDLCLLEGIPNVNGLTVGSDPSIGQIVAAIGHPALMKLSLSRGEVITQEDGMTMKGPISITNPQTGEEAFIPPEAGGISPSQCSSRKHRQIAQDLNLGFIILRTKACAEVVENAYRTNMLVQGGSSGSPVVDFWGNVVGVVFAKDSANWGIAVSHKDIAEFLKGY